MSGQASIAEINPKNYQFLQEHVYSHAGIVLEGDKHYLFESRLAPIVRQLGLESIDDLCVLIQSSCQPEVEPPGCRGHDDQRDLLLPRSLPLRCHTDGSIAAVDERAWGYKEDAVLVGCLLHWAGSLQPGHASHRGGVERLEYSDSWHRLLLAGYRTRPIGKVPADRSEPRSAGNLPDQAFSPFGHRLEFERSGAPHGHV